MDDLLKTNPEVPNIEPYTEEWDVLAGQVAKNFVNEMYPCAECSNPVIRGYKCDFCGTYNPEGL
ncbi:MAG: hypothetical protein ACTSVR_03190 [Candidatus Thorarchaeota archaeon]